MFTSILSAIHVPVSRPGASRRVLSVSIKAVKRLPVREGALLVKHVLPAIWKPVHSLWNEVIGFLFLCLAIIGGFQAVRHFRANDDWGVVIAVPFTLIMLWFGIDSFRRARKISRS